MGISETFELCSGGLRPKGLARMSLVSRRLVGTDCAKQELFGRSHEFSIWNHSWHRPHGRDSLHCGFVRNSERQGRRHISPNRELGRRERATSRLECFYSRGMGAPRKRYRSHQVVRRALTGGNFAPLVGPATFTFAGNIQMSLGLILLVILIIMLLGGFSRRFAGYGYGYGHRGIGLFGIILIILLILLLMHRI